MSRLSHRGTVTAFSAVTCTVIAGLASLGGESIIAVGWVTTAAVLAAGITVRDVLGTAPSPTVLISLATVCGLGAVASLPGQRWFTAAALVGVGVMNFARASGKWVPEDAEQPE